MNMNNNLVTRLKKIIVLNSLRDIKEEDVNEESDLINDLEFDSVQIVQMILDLESEFNITINDEDIQLSILTKYAELKNLVFEKIASVEL